MSKKRTIDKDLTLLNEPPSKKQKLNENSNSNRTNNNNVDIEFDIDWFGGSDKGKKAHMEDRRISINDLSSKFNHPFTKKNNCRLFGIIDGHGGSAVSSYVESNLVSVFIDNLKKYMIDKEKEKEEITDLDIQRVLHATFKNLDKKILGWMNPMKSEGATCTLSYFYNNFVFTANIGDSKAVLARKSKDDDDEKIESLLITKDHTVLQLCEIKRIESFGGNIMNGRVNGILQISRCFGDYELKKLGIISTPNISKFKICKRDEFMIIACDGLWSVFSLSDAVEFVYKKLNDISKPSIQEITRQLLAEAIFNKQAKDNVSAIIIRFNHH